MKNQIFPEVWWDCLTRKGYTEPDSMALSWKEVSNIIDRVSPNSEYADLSKKFAQTVFTDVFDMKDFLLLHFSRIVENYFWLSRSDAMIFYKDMFDIDLMTSILLGKYTYLVGIRDLDVGKVEGGINWILLGPKRGLRATELAKYSGTKGYFLNLVVPGSNLIKIIPRRLELHGRTEQEPKFI